MKMIKCKELSVAKRITEYDIIDHLGGIPNSKTDCICLVKRTLEKIIELFYNNKKAK